MMAYGLPAFGEASWNTVEMTPVGCWRNNLLVLAAVNNQRGIRRARRPSRVRRKYVARSAPASLTVSRSLDWRADETALGTRQVSQPTMSGRVDIHLMLPVQG